MLLPGGFLAIADLDTEPGLFHGPMSRECLPSWICRRTFMDLFVSIGLIDVTDVTAHVIYKPIANGTLGSFRCF